MKKLMLLMATLLTLTVFAKPVSSGDITKINKYLEQLIGENDEGVYVKFLSANVNDDDNLLDASKIEVGFLGLQIDLAVSMDEELISLFAGFKAPLKELGEPEDIKEMIAALEATADEINKKGTYKVNLLKFKSSEGLTLTMNIAPVLKDSSLKSVVVDVYIPNDFEKNLTASLNGLFHSKSDTVINGRIALTNIVNNLIANVEPAEADIDVITKIIEDLLGELEE